MSELFGHRGTAFARLVWAVVGFSFALASFPLAAELGSAPAVFVFAFAFVALALPGALWGLCLAELGASTGRDGQQV